MTGASSGGAAKESRSTLNDAPLRLIVWIGVVLIGMVLPLVQILFIPSTMAAACAFILLGDPCFVTVY